MALGLNVGFQGTANIVRQREATTTRSAMPQQKDPNRENNDRGLSPGTRVTSGAAAR